MTTNAHTPTPWSAEFNGGRGAWIKGSNSEWSALACGDTDDSANHNAAFIVRAVNAHAELVECAKRLAGLENDDGGRGFPSKEDCSFARAILAKLEAAS